MSDEPHQTSRLIEEEDVDRDIDKIEEASRQLHDLLVLFERTYSAGGRELALAKTNLEQAVMWAVKGIMR
jgi:hypothetical protein